MRIGKLSVAKRGQPPELRWTADAFRLRPGQDETIFGEANQLLPYGLTGNRQTLAECRRRLRAIQLERQHDALSRRAAAALLRI
ncbi:hypothetical protein D9M72_514170 [compost metagenome]